MAVNNGTVSVSNQDLSSQSGYYDRNILFVGIKATGGTADSFELKKNILSVNEVNTFYSRSSHIAQGLKYAVNFANQYNFGDNNLKINAVGINQVGTKATASHTFTGTATEEKIIKIYAGDKINYKTLTIKVGDAASDIATNLTALLNADLDLFFVAAVDGVDDTKVNLIASVEGSWCNYVKIKITDLPAGITCNTVQFTGGNYTGLSNLTALKTAIEKDLFDLIVIEKDLLDLDTSLKTFLDTRATLLRNQNLIGQVLFATINNTASSISNSYSYNQWGISVVKKSSYTLPFLLLADIAAMKEGRLVEGFRASKISTLESNGGVRHANAPINEIRLNVENEIFSDEQFTDEELITLNANGFLTIEENENKLAILTGNQSMYILDANGNPTSLSRITDFEKKELASREFFETIKTFKNKTLVATIVNPEHDITKQQIASKLKEVIATCTGKKTYIDINGNYQDVSYGIFQNSAQNIQIMEDVIDASVNKLSVGRSINLEAQSILNIIIENVGLNNLFTN